MLTKLRNMFGPSKPTEQKVSPFKEAGTSGTAVVGGFVMTNEVNPKAVGQQRYQTAADMLANVSIIAAGVRYYLNLVAKPKWLVEPVDDTSNAKQYAEFVESVMDGMSTSWHRIIRRSALYRYHGFGIQEWTAMKRDDGQVGFSDIETRPQHTIERWDVDEKGTVQGVWQRSPQTGHELYLPRYKIIYLVDDSLTDSPEGMGWFRHLIEPSERLKNYLRLEALGYQRDLSGIPVARAPITAINKAVAAGKIKQEDAAAMIAGIKAFVKMEVRKENTGLLIDSQPFENQGPDGPTMSGVQQWGLELLTGSSETIEHLGKAIDRLTVDMARVIGVENILTGSDGSGSLALSRDKSNNLYLVVNSTLGDMAEHYNRDVVNSLWTLNGFPDEMKPKLKTEDVSFRDVEQVTAALRDMATAGAVLAPDDPAIDDIRDLLGISRQEKPAEVI